MASTAGEATDGKDGKTAFIQRVFDDALRLHQAGNLQQAELRYREILKLNPRHADSLHLLGVIASQVGKPDIAVAMIGQAIAVNARVALYHSNLGNAFNDQRKTDEAAQAYERALELNPNFAEAHNNLANVLKGKGRLDEAMLHYQRALAITPTFAEAHNNLGNALKDQDKLDEAMARYQKAIALKPDYIEAHFNLANALKDQGKFDEAIVSYEQALALKPTFAEAHNNLANVLKNRGQIAQAVAHYEQAVAAKPDFGEAHYNLGNALADQGRYPEAETCFEKLSSLRPDDAEAMVAFANALLLSKRPEDADRLFRRAHQIRPLARRAGKKSPADFSVLLLNSPGGGNTPSDYLVGRGQYDSYFLMILTGVNYDAAILRENCDVVMNLLSDVDRGRVYLPLAAELIDRLERPVINHPRAIMTTARDVIATRLAGIPGARVAKTRRMAASALTEGAQTVLDDFGGPVLVRMSGTHGGDEFEKVTDAAKLAAFVGGHYGADHYVSEYIPYESADGYFRKYRLIFIGGEILPYHLAISDQWKVHHFRTDMANQEWMRAEERTFVEDPRAVFGSAQWAALEAIRDTIKLDYFGIDCGIDQAGKVVVFEVNATMLVHDETAIFAYKAPYIARIKQAFDTMLARAVGKG